MAQALTQRGASVTIATSDDAGPGRRMTAEEIQDCRSRFGALGIDVFFAAKRTEFYKVSPQLAYWLLRHARSYDVIHIHALFSFSSVVASGVAALRGVPFVVRPLGVLGRYGMTKRRPLLKRCSMALIERPILRRAGAVHCTSEAELDEVRRNGEALRAVVVPLAVEAPQSTASAELLHEITWPKGSPRILFLSRLDPKKNLEGLFRALAVVDARGGMRSVLIVAGTGEPHYVAALQRLAEELGIADRVAWLGAVAGERKAAVWAAADLFVLASHEENFGIAAAEAMLAGLPCVLGAGVAIGPDAAAAGAALVTTCAPTDIANCVERLLEDRALARAMGRRAKAYAAREFSAEVMAERLIALYEKLAPTRAVAAARAAA